LTLFAYTKNRLELTQEGESFFERATELLEMSDSIREEYLDSSRHRPVVRLGIPPMLSTVFFPDLMDAFHLQHPEIYLELAEYGSVRACDMVQDEQLDIGLVNMELYSIDKFSNIVLANDKLVFCVAQNNPLAGTPEITLEQLDSVPLILFNHDSVQNHVLNQYFHTFGIQPRVILHSSQLLTTLKFLRQGKCGCFLFSSMLSNLPELTAIPVRPEIGTKIGLVWKKGKYISTHTQTFIQFCRR
jgi:DNA-binding transcriptional LysR family regulator